MKVHFLGGSDEVGASCLLVEISGHRIVIDCGIRMKERDGERVPDLAKLHSIGDPEAVILTHAHIDHSGALPVLYKTVDVPMYLTPPTLSLINIMLLDARKIMEIEREEEVPLYSLHEVEKVVTAARPVPFSETVELFSGAVRFTFYPAGHILGAASVLIDGKKDGRLLITGDVSQKEQATIGGIELPEKIYPDLVVIESTYGGRFHSDRKQQESMLIDKVKEVVMQSGAILIPAFAVGRAQEVILILSAAIEAGKIPFVPILVDGLVKNICQVYRSYPDMVTPWLKKQIHKKGNPFFYDDGPAIPIWEPGKREEYAKLRPAIIVSSSGMLMGGPSSFYAEALAEDPKNFIAITGYQDEEAPGRRIQELAAAGHGQIQLGERIIDFKCGVGTYSLSAHADTEELVEILKNVSARNIALVHGDHYARKALHEALSEAGVENVHLPKISTQVSVGANSQHRLLPRKKSTAEEAPLIHEKSLMALAKKLIKKDGENRPYTVQEIMIGCNYPPEAITANEVERVQSMLAKGISAFVQDRKKKFIFRIRTDKSGPVGGKKFAKFAEEHGRWPEQKLVEKIEEIFADKEDFYRKGVKSRSNELVLYFHFPDKAQERYGEIVKSLQKESQWQITIAPRPHQEVLATKAIEAVGKDYPLKKNPSIFLQEKEVVLQLSCPAPAAEQLAKAMADFHEYTGFTIVVKGTATTSSPGEKPKTVTQTPTATASERYEINQAFALISSRFASLPHQPIKKSLKIDTIELAFITNQVASRYRETIDALAKETGWPITIRQSPEQTRLREIAKKTIPEDWQITKEPKIYSNEALVVVCVSSMEEPKMPEIIKQFDQQTGFELRVECSSQPQFAIKDIELDKIQIPRHLAQARLNQKKNAELLKLMENLGKAPKPVDVKQITVDKYLLEDGYRRIVVARQLGHSTILARIIC